MTDAPKQPEGRGSSRRPRGRVLLVGQPEGWSLPPLARQLTAVDTIFEAIGEVSTATANRPIELVLLTEGSLGEGEAADAIRRVDPAVRIARIHSGPSSGSTPHPPGAFDLVLCLPADTAQLYELLDEAPPVESPAPPPDAPATTTTTTTTATPTLSQDAPVFTAPTSVARESLAERAREPVESKTPPASAVDPPAPLGDVDLVEAMLREPDRLVELAVQLIEQQTGWPDVRLVAPDDDEAEGARVAVTHADRRFGWLSSDHATSVELRPWADWLARWLTLHHTLLDHQTLAYQDDLTSAWNRRFFARFLTDTIERARELRHVVSVMVFDIDDFKRYNDSFGHDAGDVVLVETVRLLNSVIRQGDRVCRIGGDEFAVIFADLEGPREPGSSHPAAPEQIASRFQDQIRQMRFPKLGLEAPGTLSISAGLATYPWDGTTPDELLRCADHRALISKRKGKNAITLGPGAE